MELVYLLSWLGRTKNQYKLAKLKKTVKVFKLERVKESTKQVVTNKSSKQVFAEKLRENPTESEIQFCKLFDKLKLEYTFQKVVCGYIPDFSFPKKRLIEVDGISHKGREEYDNRKDKVLRKAGYHVLRVAANRIFWDVDRLTVEIQAFLAGQYVKRKKAKKRCVRIGRDNLQEQFMQATHGI